MTPEERDVFSNKMVEETEKITELYLQQQKFHERILKNVGGTIAIVVFVGAAIPGIKQTVMMIFLRSKMRIMMQLSICIK